MIFGLELDFDFFVMVFDIIADFITGRVTDFLDLIFGVSRG